MISHDIASEKGGGVKATALFFYFFYKNYLKSFDKRKILC